MDAIRNYVKGAFEGVEPTPEVLDQQEEIVADLSAKVRDLVAEGRSEEEALGIALASAGDLTVLAREFKSAEDARVAAAAQSQPRTGFPRWAKVALLIVVVLPLVFVVIGAVGFALWVPAFRVVSEVSSGSTEVDQTQVEYRQAAARLTLPPGVVFPSNADAGEEIDSTVYSEGAGTTSAQSYWVHAWETEWLAQRTEDSTRAAAALEVLRNEVPTSEVMTTYSDDESRRVWQEYITEAKAGDPSGFQRHVDANPIELQLAPSTK